MRVDFETRLKIFFALIISGIIGIAAFTYQPELNVLRWNFWKRDFHFATQQCNGSWTHKMGEVGIAQRMDFWNWATGGPMPMGAENGSADFQGCFCVKGPARHIR